MALRSLLRPLLRHFRPLLPLVASGRAVWGVCVRRIGPGRRISQRGVDQVELLDGWTGVEKAETVQLAPPELSGGALPGVFKDFTGYATRSEGSILLQSVRFWGHYGGVVLDRDFRLLLPFSHSPWHDAAHPARLRWKWPEARTLPGVTAVLCTPEADDNFWHWTTELLPRLHLLRAAGWTDDRVDRYFVNGPRGGFRTESLRELGLSDDKVMHVDASHDFVLERGLFTTRRMDHHHLPPWAHRFLRDSQPRAPWLGARRLYLSRQGCAFRRALDPGPMEALLRSRGFEEFRPELHPGAVQRGAFASAEAIVGIHGSGFTNVIHSQPGTRVIEIFPPLYHDLAFFVASRLSGARYGLVNGRGELPPEGVHPRARFADVDVDVDALKSALDAFGL